jgi:hypothetical protein
LKTCCSDFTWMNVRNLRLFSKPGT